MTTTNKGFDQPAYNSNVNTWGTGPLNSNFGLIDIAFGGSTLLNATGLGGTTVSLTQSQCRPASLVVSGSPGGVVVYEIPAGVGGQWIVRNGVADGYAIRVQSASGGAYVSISAGDNLEVSCDGSASGIVRNTTAVTNAAGSNTQVQYNSAGAMAGSANLTFNGTTLSVTGLNNSGNTVLGDAAGDTLTINSNAMAIPNTLNIGSNTLYLSPSGTQVGIGTTTVGSNKLTVAGTVASTAGGFVFPDSTVQTTAAVAGPALIVPPQGRPTLVTNVPVMTSAQTGKTTIYYTAYVGNQVPVYDGSSWSMATFAGDLSNITTNSAVGNAGPAVCGNNSIYDLFIWSNSGTLTLTRGPAWTSDTARGTGAGTTELQAVSGLLTNKVAITNGPGANRGTYVGSFRTDGSAQINWNTVTADASGGLEAKLHVFSAYNRIKTDGRSSDMNANWPYGTPAWRAINNSTSLRISYLDGLGELAVSCSVALRSQTSDTAQTYYIGIDRDSTSATPDVFQFGTYPVTTTSGSFSSPTDFWPSLGYHYLQPVEYASGAGPSAGVPILTATLVM